MALNKFDYEAVHQMMREKAEKAEKELLEKEQAKAVKLPPWSHIKRGTPNALLRGSLFAAIRSNNRRSMTRELIVNEEKLQIRFTGIQLDQTDLEVWETAVHMARSKNLGHEIEFSAYQFLKSLGRKLGKSGRDWLQDAFARLAGCAVEITHDNKTYLGSMLELYRDEATARHKLTINPRVGRLYDAGYTQINWEDRKKIGNKKPLALWIHGYISTHVDLFRMKIETIHRLSGSNNKDMKDFKKHLKTALEHLKEKEIIQGYFFEGDKVRIIKRPSQSQQKYQYNR